MKDSVAEPSSLQSQLRSATRPEHVRLEQLLGLPESVDQHTRRLKKFYGFYAVWEPLVMSRLSMLGPAIDDRRKIPLLQADLLYLGLPAHELRCLPLCDQLPDMPTRATALGSMYVMEGSTLGGQIIARHLETVIGLSQGYCYYKSYGPAVGKMWKAFLATMESQTEPPEQQRLIDAARQTFSALHRWFSLD